MHDAPARGVLAAPARVGATLAREVPVHVPHVVPLAVAAAMSSGIAGRAPEAPARPSLQARETAPVAIPLRTLFGRLRTVRVRVGEDSLDFLFDTGNGTTLLSPELATKLGCHPVGRAVGFRMTGERMEGPRCEGVHLEVGGIAVELSAGVVDVSRLLDRPAPGVAGVLSLAAFAGRAITLDLARGRLVVESPASLAARTRTMTRVPLRLATGIAGAELCAFVGIPSARATLWLEWDSGHQAPVFLAPHAARLLGVPDSLKRVDVELPLANGVVVPALVRDIIYDGVLGAAAIERAVWTLDLARGRMWVSALAPIPALPRDTAAVVTPPSADPTGVYETSATIQGHVQRGVLIVRRDDGALRAFERAVGEDDIVQLPNVAATGNELRYTLPLREPTPAHVAFDGLVGTGTWGDPANGRGGALRLVKRADRAP